MYVNTNHYSNRLVANPPIDNTNKNDKIDKTTDKTKAQDIDIVSISFSSKAYLSEKVPGLEFADNGLHAWVNETKNYSGATIRKAVTIPKALEIKMDADPALAQKIADLMNSFKAYPGNRFGFEFDENGEITLGCVAHPQDSENKTTSNNGKDIFFEGEHADMTDFERDEILVKTFSGEIIDLSTGDYKGKA